MQYLRNLQSQLSQSLWIRSHREPNIQGDFNDSASISVISSLDNNNSYSSTTTRFSTSSTTTTNANGDSANATTVVPHSAANNSTTSYHKDDIIATVLTSSSSSRRNSRKLSSEATAVEKATEIKSAFTSYNNNNTSNSNSSHFHPSCHHNRVCSSTTRREVGNVEELIYPGFQQQQSSKRRNSSYSSSTAGGSELQPVILSLTPLSKSIKKEYCLHNGNSIFHSPTNAHTVVLPSTSSLSSSLSTSTATTQFSKRVEPWDKSDADKCFKDSSSNKSSRKRFPGENLGRKSSSSSSSFSASTFNRGQDQKADHERESLLVSDPLLLQLLESSESEIAQANENISQKKNNKEEKLPEEKKKEQQPLHRRKKIGKSEWQRKDKCFLSDSSSSSANSGIDDDETVFVDGTSFSSQETNDGISTNSTSNYINNRSSSSSNNNNNIFFLVTSGTSSPLTSSSIKQDNKVHEIQSANRVSLSPEEGQQLSGFDTGEKEIDRCNSSSVGSFQRRKTPSTRKKSRKGSSISTSDFSTSGSSRSSLFWNIEQRQVQSCREGERRKNKDYGKLGADRESITTTESGEVSEKSLLLERVESAAAEEDKVIQKLFLESVVSTRSSTKSSTSASSSGTKASLVSQEKETTDVLEEEAGERRTSPDQSCPSGSSRFTTFTRDRSSSASSSTSSTTSSSSGNGTLFGSPVSSVSDLASVILVNTASSREIKEAGDNNNNNTASSPVVVVSPSYSVLSSSISTFLSHTSTPPTTTESTDTNTDAPLFTDEVESDGSESTASGYSYSGYYYVEGLNCSQRVNQRKKSINNNNNCNSKNASGDVINSETSTVGKRKRASIIQHLLCTNPLGFNLFVNPKKLLSVIFRRRCGKRQAKKKTNRKFLSFSPSYSASSSGVVASNSNSNNSKTNNNKRFNKRAARRRRGLLKLTTQVTSRAPTKTELRLWATMDHEDLIRELPQIEKLSNQERLRLAHKRRMLQLKKFQQYEKELNSNSKKHRGDSDLVRRNLPGKHNNNHHHGKGGKGSRRIRFRNSIMLLEAAGRNDVEEVRLLLESGVNPDVANEDGLTALHQCCIDDNEEMMKLLLDFGANVNSEDSERWTPLHAAATCGHLHLVQYLIARGANLLAVNAEGNMPYDICDDETTLDYIESEMAKRGVTQELIEEIRALPETKMLQEIQRIHAQGGDLECRDADGATPLHIASANGYYRVAEFLLDNHAATDVQDKDFWQPIHAAACWGHLDVLELLVQNGADLDARTKNNETPYAICEDPEIKERIIQLRTEQQTKRQNEGRKRPSRTHSTNSRTQSIRRTSQRDKGLTSKRDAADEAQMLRAREELHKENSPSPTTDVTGANKNATSPNGSAPTANGNAHPPLSGDSQNNVQTNGNGNASSEEDPEIVIPPHLIGRDSVGNMKMKQDEMNRLREIAVKSGAVNHNNHLNNHNHNNTNNSASNGGLKMNNLLYNEQNGSLMKNQNNIQKNLNNSGSGNAGGNSPVTVLSSPDDNGNLLPKPEINPSVDNKVPLGGGGLGLASGMPLSGSRDNLVGLSSSAGNSTIDIHVSVTINTNSPVSTLTNGHGGGLSTPPNNSLTSGNYHGYSNGGPHSIPLSPGSSIFTPPGTLSDLKKQRSLIRTSSNPLTNGTLTNLIALPILPTTSTTNPVSSTAFSSPSFETFKPLASASTATTTATLSNSSSADSAFSSTKTASISRETFCEEVVPLSPAALLLQKNNQKNTSSSATFANCSQSSASSWHYYWNDWRNGFSYSQSQFDSAAFSSSTLPSTTTCSSSSDFPPSPHQKHQPQQHQQQQQQPTVTEPGNNKCKENGGLVVGVGGRGCSIIGGVPVLPTSATSNTLFPLGSYYFNSSSNNGSGGGTNNGGGGSNNAAMIPYDFSASSQYNNLGDSSANTLTNTNNPFSNNQHCCYLNNLTGGMNDAMTKYPPPASPTMSLRRFVGDTAETGGDYGDGGKRCCVIV